MSLAIYDHPLAVDSPVRTSSSLSFEVTRVLVNESDEAVQVCVQRTGRVMQFRIHTAAADAEGKIQCNVCYRTLPPPPPSCNHIIDLQIMERSIHWKLLVHFAASISVCRTLLPFPIQERRILMN